MNKECFKCKKIKSLTDFPKDKHKPNGHRGVCKTCNRIYAADYYQKNKDWIEKSRESYIPKGYSSLQEYWKLRVRKKRATPEGRIRLAQLQSEYRKRRMAEGSYTQRGDRLHQRRRWAVKNRHKQSAHNKVYAAVQSGKLKKLPCEVCGTNLHVNAHHDDYSKPLDVKWLCNKHHFEYHKLHPEIH